VSKGDMPGGDIEHAHSVVATKGDAVARAVDLRSG
jgi:hypothetical protein